MRRVSRSREEARQNYDRLSRWYDGLSSSENPLKDRGLALLSAQPGECVLEIGYGTGRSLLSLARSVAPGGTLVGIDISMGMARHAQEKFHQTGLPPVLLTLGDAVALPYLAGRFDALFTAFTLELFDTPEIPLVLDECRRVLHQDGRLVVVSLARPLKPGLAVRIYEWFHLQMPAVVDCRPIPVCDLLKSNGFAVQKTEREGMWGLPVDIVAARR